MHASWKVKILTIAILPGVGNPAVNSILSVKNRKTLKCKRELLNKSVAQV